MRRLLHLVVPCLTVLSGCYGTEKGVEVPQDEIYFPVGLALDPQLNEAGQPKFLYVVSSDFDLQYNGGAIQSYNLEQVAAELPSFCPGSDDLCKPTKLSPTNPGEPCYAGPKSSADRLLFPGPCNSLSPDDFHDGTRTASVKIGAFATDAIIRRNAGADNPRLFVPVRGDATLHFIDVDADGNLQCGQSNNDGACDAQHRAGQDPAENTRNIVLNAEPFGIAANPQGDTVVVTNQTTGTASLFETKNWATGPQLKFGLASDVIPQQPVGVVYVPRVQDYPGLAAVEDPKIPETFMMAFRDSAQVRLVRTADDADSTPARPYLVDGGGVGIGANSVGSDSRGIAVDDSARKAALARCAPDDADCVKSAALVPLDVYVANRTPASLLIGRSQPPQEYPYFFDTIPLTAGPSRVVVGQVKNVAGESETRIFVVCFDSRRVFVYDPKRARLEVEIFTGRGPHALAIDTQRSLLYVGHFTDSYIGVYSLDLSHPATYGTMLASLGTPKAPRSSK